MLSKTIDQITLEDIESLIDEEVPEGEKIEYKSGLPSESGTTDSWVSRKGTIGKYAKKRILEETVAFANAYGGALVLGIEESGTVPPVAKKISPVPRCTELAKRFEHVFRDQVEPGLSRIEILPVPTDGDSGVIIFRVGRSRLGPHRVKDGLACPIRRSDRCEKLTMREIQDMTLNMARGMERTEGRLSVGEQRFKKEFQGLETPDNAWGLRFTAVPVIDEIRFDSVFENNSIVQELKPEHQQVTMVCKEGEVNVEFPSQFVPDSWKPRLRATSAELNSPDFGYVGYREIHCDGLIEFGLWFCDEKQHIPLGVCAVGRLAPRKTGDVLPKVQPGIPDGISGNGRFQIPASARFSIVRVRVLSRFPGINPPVAFASA